jgi:hypothetical protein
MGPFATAWRNAAIFKTEREREEERRERERASPKESKLVL